MMCRACGGQGGGRGKGKGMCEEEEECCAGMRWRGQLHHVYCIAVPPSPSHSGTRGGGKRR